MLVDQEVLAEIRPFGAKKLHIKRTDTDLNYSKRLPSFMSSRPEATLAFISSIVSVHKSHHLLPDMNTNKHKKCQRAPSRSQLSISSNYLSLPQVAKVTTNVDPNKQQTQKLPICPFNHSHKTGAVLHFWY